MAIQVHLVVVVLLEEIMADKLVVMEINKQVEWWHNPSQGYPGGQGAVNDPYRRWQGGGGLVVLVEMES